MILATAHLFLLFHGTMAIICQPQKTPPLASDPLTWPMNSSSAGVYSQTPAQMDTNAPALQSFITQKHDCLRSQQPATNMLQMQWDPTSAVHALTWAKKCTFEHDQPADRQSGALNCGQNIYMSTGGVSSWNDAINSWYGEIGGYNYLPVGQDRADPTQMVGHYTQLVWAESWLVGCAYYACPGQQFMYGCNYCPAGNYMGELPYVQGVHCAACPGNCTESLLCKTGPAPPYSSTTVAAIHALLLWLAVACCVSSVFWSHGTVL